MQILIIEDDEGVVDYVKKGLREAGHSLEHSANGKDGLTLALDHEFGVIIVDRMLPELDGLSLVKALRAVGRETPVLFLSALGDVDERVLGLKAGGDDYLIKPFAFSELLARLEALSRRPRKNTTAEPETCLTFADLRIDLLARQVTRGGKRIDLHAKEFSLLEQLVRNAGRVLTRTMLLEMVWGYYFSTQTNVIDVHISKLRKKIDDGFPSPLLHTVRGAGYKIDQDVE